jgi:hypothetical protein
LDNLLGCAGLLAADSAHPAARGLVRHLWNAALCWRLSPHESEAADAVTGPVFDPTGGVALDAAEMSAACRELGREITRTLLHPATPRGAGSAVWIAETVGNLAIAASHAVLLHQAVARPVVRQPQ